MSSSLGLELYKKLFLIRKVEDAIVKHYPENEMKCPMHMSMGQEAVSVGVCHALKPEDQVSASYRSHAAFLAKTGDLDMFFGEIYGKISGSAAGKSGSMHLVNLEKGYLGSSGIVGSNIPIAMGAAFANKYKNNGLIACAFFGDGALDEGVFWECLNVACLKKMPILFVLEDNGYAVDTPTIDRQGYRDIVEIVNKFDCKAAYVSGQDVEFIYDIAMRARTRILVTEKPAFIRFSCCRMLEHVGIRKEPNRTILSDCVAEQKKKLLDNGYKKLDLQCIEFEITDRIHEAIRSARNQPFPDSSELYRGVFYGFSN